MSAGAGEKPEVLLAREIGKVWGELGGSAEDPGLDEIARVLSRLAGGSPGRSARAKRRARRRKARE